MLKSKKYYKLEVRNEMDKESRHLVVCDQCIEMTLALLNDLEDLKLLSKEPLTGQLHYCLICP